MPNDVAPFVMIITTEGYVIRMHSITNYPLLESSVILRAAARPVGELSTKPTQVPQMLYCYLKSNNHTSNMRKIEREMNAAISNGIRTGRKTNTSVTFDA